MFKFSAKLLIADVWDGVDDRIHLQDTHYGAKRVWNGLVNQFSQFKKQYKIKGVILEQWIQKYGIGELMRSEDTVVKGAMRDIAARLQETASKDGGEFRENEIQAFKGEHGTNRVDWLYELCGQKRASQEHRVSSDLLER
jgi:hypothetical protein